MRRMILVELQVFLVISTACMPFAHGGLEAASSELSHVRHRCKGVKGSWCRSFLTQDEVAWKASLSVP